jgi:hemolysin III
VLGRKTVSEDLANSLTHGFGLLLSLVGAPWLVYVAHVHGDFLHSVSCLIYGATLVALYAASTLYHSVRDPQLRETMRTVDHACIYLLIAGTYTPLALVSLRGQTGWLLCGAVWVLAALGIGFKLFYTERFERFSTLTYVLFGWIAILVAEPLVESLHVRAVAWVVAGGIAYTGGVFFYLWDRCYAHAMWHVCVLVGSACHYLVITFYVSPPS